MSLTTKIIGGTSRCLLAASSQNTCQILSGARSLSDEKPPKKKWMRPIQMDFYYDTISPYSWLAFEILQRYKPVWNLHINFKPVYIGALSKGAGSNFFQGLTGSANKADYMFKDIERSAEYFKIPLRTPESPMYLFGVAGSLKQQRFLTAVKMHYPELLEDASRECWYRCWSEDMDATKEQSLIIVGSRAGLTEEQIAHVIDEMGKGETKEALKRTTQEALNEGAFGLPFMAVHHTKTNVETFFGSDRFEIMADRLRVKWLGPVPDPEAFEQKKIAPCPDQQEMFEELEKAGAIQVNIPEEAKSILQTPPVDKS